MVRCQFVLTGNVVRLCIFCIKTANGITDTTQPKVLSMASLPGFVYASHAAPPKKMVRLGKLL